MKPRNPEDMPPREDDEYWFQALDNDNQELGRLQDYIESDQRRMAG